MHEVDDFILPVTTRRIERVANEQMTCTDVLTPSDEHAVPTVVSDETSATPSAEQVTDTCTDYSSSPPVLTDVSVDAAPTESVSGDIHVRAGADDSLPATVFPTISASDYCTDDEFCNMYNYLHNNELTGIARTDKTTLIMADHYVIEMNGLLYRIDIPRQKKLARIKPTTKRLCVPRRFRNDIISLCPQQLWPLRCAIVISYSSYSILLEIYVC